MDCRFFRLDVHNHPASPHHCAFVDAPLDGLSYTTFSYGSPKLPARSIAAGDPLGGMEVTPAGFGLMTEALTDMAGRTARGRLALVLEGGYDLVSLREGVREALKALSARRDRPAPSEASGEDSPPGPPSPSLRFELEEPLRVFRRKWDIPTI